MGCCPGQCASSDPAGCPAAHPSLTPPHAPPDHFSHVMHGTAHARHAHSAACVQCRAALHTSISPFAHSQNACQDLTRVAEPHGTCFTVSAVMIQRAGCCDLQCWILNEQRAGMSAQAFMPLETLLWHHNRCVLQLANCDRSRPVMPAGGMCASYHMKRHKPVPRIALDSNVALASPMLQLECRNRHTLAQPLCSHQQH